jgi:DNA-binding NtrC family response regulator
MAVDLLADGRAEDVSRMLDPILNALDEDEDSTGSGKADAIRIRAIAACIDTVHDGRPGRALHRLSSFESTSSRSALPTTVRAEVSLWLGWAYAFHDATSMEEARALSLLDEAQTLFARQHNIRGQLWTRLGQARAYFALDEYNLMRQALDEAEPLVTKLNDVLASRWFHDLRVPALRFEGRYEEAERHIEQLHALAAETSQRRVQGHAAAYRAALAYDLGQPPADVVDRAVEAQRLLSPVARVSKYPLLAAVHAQVGALLRNEDSDAADEIIRGAAPHFDDYSVGRAHLQTLQARVALHQNKCETAEELLETLFNQAHHLPHGLHRSHVALLRAELLARRGDLDTVDAWARRALRNARETGHRGHQLRALCVCARYAIQRGDLERAASCLDATSAYSDYDATLPYVLLRSMTRAEFARASGDPEGGRVELALACSAAVAIGDRTMTRQLCRASSRSNDTSAPSGTHEPGVAFSTSLDDAGTSGDGPFPDSHPFPDAHSGMDAGTEENVESSIGHLLLHASRSSRLVAETWLQLVAPLFDPDPVGLYRRTASSPPEPLHTTDTLGIAARSRSRDTADWNAGDAEDDGVLWIPLDSPRSSDTFFGVRSRDDGPPSSLDRVRPWLPVLALALQRAQDHGSVRTLPRRGFSSIPMDGFIAESPAMQAVAQQLHRIQASHSPVLVTSERGAGAPLVARAVHVTSEREGETCEVVQCANMQQDPVEAHVFGSMDGGDLQPRALQSADGGTLILQDVDALSASAQARLLELLDDGRAVPVGASRPTPVDVRIVATSSADLDQEIQDGRFREDLYLRLNTIPVRVPPLRHRLEDIPLLTRHFTDTLCASGTPSVSVTPQVLDAFLHYDWPGNVRQLRNEIERALLLVQAEPAPTINRSVLSEPLQEAARNATPTSPSSRPSLQNPSRRGIPTDLDAVLQPDTSLSDVLASTEAVLIKHALAACDGQITATADLLGLTRQGLYKKMKRLDIDAAVFQPDPA